VNTGPRPEYEDLTPDFGRIKAPTLIVWGAEDRAGPIDVGLFMTRAIPDARMHVFNKCGHWAQVERTAEVGAHFRLAQHQRMRRRGEQCRRDRAGQRAQVQH